MVSSSRRTFLQSSAAAAGLALHPKLWAFAGDAPIAGTTAGKVSGYTEEGIHIFKSIPYGADTAKTRFQAPLPPEKWTGVKECMRFTTIAPQLVPARSGRNTSPTGNLATSASGVPGGPSDAGVQSEDCLHLNVFTPGLRDGKKRPLLCYFHGGAYNNGTVNNDLYDGRRLCHRGDVVVVTVNHRLNAFGYMFLGSLSGRYVKSGNAGQLDLVLALQWIKDNIAEFGGDASRVLIFGQSGGGAKCAALMATPVAHGLFHRVMTMSGQQIKGASIEIASERAKTVLEKLGAAGLKGAELEAKLNTATMEQIQEAARAVSGDWLPVVDGIVLPRNPFDSDAPKLSASVPMMLGNVHDETIVSGPGGGAVSWDNAAEVLDAAVHQYLGPVKADEAVAEFRRIHPDYSPQQVCIAAATAFRAWPGQRMEAERRGADPESQPRTWVYQMNFTGANGRAMHTIDIPFMFDNIEHAKGQIGSSPEQLEAANRLAAIMSQMLITYGRTGDPNGDDPGGKPTQDGKLPFWPAYDLKNRATMMWERTPRVENDPRATERRFAEQSHYHQAGTPLP